MLQTHVLRHLFLPDYKEIRILILARTKVIIVNDAAYASGEIHIVPV